MFYNLYYVKSLGGRYEQSENPDFKPFHSIPNHRLIEKIFTLFEDIKVEAQLLSNGNESKMCVVNLTSPNDQCRLLIYSICESGQSFVHAVILNPASATKTQLHISFLATSPLQAFSKLSEHGFLKLFSFSGGPDLQFQPQGQVDCKMFPCHSPECAGMGFCVNESNQKS